MRADGLQQTRKVTVNIGIQDENIRVTTLTLRDRFDVFTAPALRSEIETLLQDGVSRLIIDLSEVTFLDSAALAVLVNTLKHMRTSDGELVLVWPQAEEARRIFHLTKFYLVFAMADNVADARRLLGTER